MQQETKEEVGGGIFGGVLITTLIALLIILLPPFMHFVGWWSGYWNNDTPTSTWVPPSISTTTNQVFRDDAFERNSAANAVCNKRAEETFHVPFAGEISYASSTSPDAPYTTYDCYGVKLQKI